MWSRTSFANEASRRISSRSWAAGAQAWVCTRVSGWGNGPLIAGNDYAGSAALMRHYIAGLVEHAAALLPICSRSGKSHGPLTPSLGAPVNLDYSRFDHSSMSQAPMNSRDLKASRAELRCPGLPDNPYLAFAAMLMARIDGFQNRLYHLDPDEPLQKLYKPFHELASGSFDSLLDALETDHAFFKATCSCQT
jgi:glutamine synthetase